MIQVMNIMNQRTKREVSSINTISEKRLGLAVGSTFALMYIACVIIVMAVGREGVIFMFNTLFHGIDATSLIRTTMPLSSMAIGLIEIFILGWLVGATIASVYNLSSRWKE